MRVRARAVKSLDGVEGGKESEAWHVYAGHYFPHTGSPPLRQMENRRGEQGGNSAYSGLLSHCTHRSVRVCALTYTHTRTCFFSVCQVLLASGTHFKWE